MTRSRFKSITLRIFLVGIFILLLSPLYMYASYDVEKLNRLYPHGKISGLDISYELKEKKPKAWVNLRSISKFAKWAIVLSEDWGFYQHQGIDINQIKSAFSEMLAGERFRGASTITQQMVKNIYLTEDRTLWRKLHEIILAQKVERVMSKDRILEIYLNSIEYGPGIFGISQASYHYFKKHPSALTAKEGAFLAMLLPSPKKYYVSFKKRRLTTFARERIQNILVKMRMGKVISPDQHSSLKDVRLSWEK